MTTKSESVLDRLRRELLEAAKDFGERYLMLPDGTRVLRSSWDWMNQNWHANPPRFATEDAADEWFKHELQTSSQKDNASCDSEM